MKYRCVYSLILFLFLLPTSACSGVEPDINSIRLEVGDKNLASYLKAELDRENIWYHVIDDSTLEVKLESAGKAASLLNSMADLMLPKGRHASFPKDMFLAVTKKLDKNNISYQIVDFNNSKWVVWEVKDTQVVEQVIDEVSLTQDTENLKESDFRH